MERMEWTHRVCPIAHFSTTMSQVRGQPDRTPIQPGAPCPHSNTRSLMVRRNSARSRRTNSQMDGPLKTALYRRGGGASIHITEDDLVGPDTEYQTSCATVVLLDMSGSMSRYGKYGQAKKVAMALAALVRGKYQGDFLQVV